MLCIMTEIRKSLQIYAVVYFRKQLNEFVPASSLHIIFTGHLFQIRWEIPNNQHQKRSQIQMEVCQVVNTTNWKTWLWPLIISPNFSCLGKQFIWTLPFPSTSKTLFELFLTLRLYRKLLSPVEINKQTQVLQCMSKNLHGLLVFRIQIYHAG